MIRRNPSAEGPRDRSIAGALCRTVALAIALLAMGCSIDVPDTTVSGTATYRERMLLRPGSVLEVSIVDASRADASAPTLASVRIEDLGSPPFAFEIPIDSSVIDQRGTYVARATIRRGDELIMTTDTAYPVLTRGAGVEVELLLRMAAVPDEPRDRAPLANLPATYTGVLPCADCPGIDYALDLFPDSVYYLKQSYVDRNTSIDRIGAWSANQESATLALFTDTEELIRFRIVDGETLRLLDREGRDIESSLSYDLRRAPSFDPFTLELPLRGMYRYMADAGLFVECESGRRFDVAQEADNAALERAYLTARREPGDELLVSFDGRITMRAPMEGPGLRPAVIPVRFTGVWPSETCGARMSMSELLGTNWVLTRIGDEAVAYSQDARESRLVLQADGERVSGFGGCNDFNGGVEITGRSIRFGPLAATMRACIDDMDRESAFFSALESAASYRLYRHHLELLDGDGKPLARLEARELF